LIGDIVHGQYRILGKLGEGGMGEIFLAEQIRGGDKVALKVLHSRLATEEEFVSRFRREVRATSRLQHPNIVRVYDFGKLSDGRFFIAMDLADGETLDSQIRASGGLDVGRSVRILTQLAEAVDHAHSRGVVHRDLKPENVMLVTRGGRADVVKVLDFGIAKIVAADYSENRRLSQQGLIFGTPHYMSPEQIGGVGTDPRLDLYAIGCIAFEMVTGTPLYNGTAMEIMQQHMASPPDRPSDRRSELPPELDAVILACLEKDPARRFQNGRALATALERVPGIDASAPPSVSSGAAPAGLPVVENRDPTIRTQSPFAEVQSTARREQSRVAVARALVDALVDRGHDEVELIAAATELKLLERELERCAGELAELDERADEIEQAGLAREADIGIRLGELSFERRQAAARQDPVQAIEVRIRQTEAELAESAREVERELYELAEGALALADQRATAEEQLSDRLEALEPTLQRHAVAHASDAALITLFSRLANAR
jgi:serine/threonine-protein kinase